MRTGLVFAVLVAVASCVPKKPVGPVGARPPAASTARPFDAAPFISLVDPAQTGPMYRVQIGADITRDVVPTDDLAIVLSVGDLEVGRYPVVGRYAASPTRIKQEVEIPLGDYEINFAYQGQVYAGMPFRLAQVPVWGGRKTLQLRTHPGTRVSLREGKLWVGRWWSNDGPPQAWIVEWVHEGQVATTTSGSEAVGIPPHAPSIVGGAAGAFRAAHAVENTIWAYGEEYPVPAEVGTSPGVWAARIVHGGSAPISVLFTVLPGGVLAEADNRVIISAGWQPSWSKRLEQRSLNMTEVDRLTAKMPHTGVDQPFDELVQGDRLAPAIRVSTAGVRALFRSRQLAELWWDYEEQNTATPGGAPTANGFPRTSKKRTAGLGSNRHDSPTERRARLKTLRGQIEQLIKTNGGPWKPDEFPKS